MMACNPASGRYMPNSVARWLNFHQPSTRLGGNTKPSCGHARMVTAALSVSMGGIAGNQTNAEGSEGEPIAACISNGDKVITEWKSWNAFVEDKAAITRWIRSSNYCDVHPCFLNQFSKLFCGLLYCDAMLFRASLNPRDTIGGGFSLHKKE